MRKILFVIFLLPFFSVAQSSQDVFVKVDNLLKNITFLNKNHHNYIFVVYTKDNDIRKEFENNRITINSHKVNYVFVNKVRKIPDKFDIFFGKGIKSWQLKTVYEKAKKNKALLITYDASDLSNTMINLTDQGTELNTKVLLDLGFIPSEQMVATGGTKEDLRALYKSKVALLEKKEVELDSLLEVVSNQQAQNDSNLAVIAVKNRELNRKQELLNKQEKNLKRLAFEIKLQKNIILIVVFFLFALLIQSIFLFVAWRKNKMMNHRLLQSNEQIRNQKKRIEQQAREIEQQRDLAVMRGNELEKINKEIKASINYAKRIQIALLPDLTIIKKYVNDYFLIYKPKDIVSGDFYWSVQFGDVLYLVAADCTGHGVPGAFMSALGISYLTHLVKNPNERPAEVLEKLRQNVIKSLKQNSDDFYSSKDGMDLAFIRYDKKNGKIDYAGAYNSIFLITASVKNFSFDMRFVGETRNEGIDKILYEIKADRMPIGIHLKKNKFTTKTFDIKKGDKLYMFSDGFQDLFNFKTEEKYSVKRFKNLLLQTSVYSMTEQMKLIENEYEKWLDGDEQVDDILIMGLEF